MNWKIVHSYGNRIEADMAVALLASSGIEGMISGGDMGGTNPLYSYSFGVNVLVEEGNFEDATSILKEQAQNNHADKPAPIPITGSTRILLHAMQIFWFCSIISFFVGAVEPAFIRVMDGMFTTLMLCLFMLSFILTIAYVMSKRAAERRRRESMI